MSKNFGQQGYGSPEISSYSFQQNKRLSRGVEQKSRQKFEMVQGREALKLQEQTPGLLETLKQLEKNMTQMGAFERALATRFAKEGTSPQKAREILSSSKIHESGRARIIMVLSLFLAANMILAACGAGPITEMPPTGVAPTTETASAPATETMPADESTPVVGVTEAATDTPDFDGSYFTYDQEVEQHKTEADSILEKNWALIYEKIIKAGIAVNFEVTCLTADNFCIKPADGYPEGTYFSLSYVPGFEGQVITLTTGRASEVAGVEVVEITIGEGRRQVGLDANGNVVVFVNGAGAWEKGSIGLATDLVDDLETASELTIEQMNENVGDSVHVTKTFKGVEYNIYWDPIKGQWRSDHNTPKEELDLTGDSFPELIASPDEITLENINLPGLGEKSLAEIYQMSDAELKKYVIGLALEGKKASDPSITPEKLKEIENYFNNSNTKLLPVIIDPNNSEQNDIYTLWFSPAQGPTASIPEASVTFHDGRPTNTVLMPILNNSGEIICFVRIHQASELKSGVTEFSGAGAFNTGAYTIDNPKVFGNTNGDGFAILVYDTAGPFEDVSTGPILEGEEGIGDANTIEKLKNAQSLEEVMAILEEIRLIALETPRTIVERE